MAKESDELLTAISHKALTQNPLPRQGVLHLSPHISSKNSRHPVGYSDADLVKTMRGRRKQRAE